MAGIAPEDGGAPVSCSQAAQACGGGVALLRCSWNLAGCLRASGSLVGERPVAADVSVAWLAGVVQLRRNVDIAAIVRSQSCFIEVSVRYSMDAGRKMASQRLAA